jgi:sulfite reductase alpha subunit-like flavoprotein
MYLALSPDQKENIYVQKLMLKQGAEMWKWLQEGASASYIAMLKKDKRHLRAVY